MRHLIIVNQKAGHVEESKNFLQDIENEFKGLDFEVHVTKGPREVIDFIPKYCDQFKNDTVRVYACGGDGTIHEVANGLANCKNAELAIYPIGTGNDFVKIYAKTDNYDEIVKDKAGAKRFLSFKDLINAKASPIDLCEITGETLDKPWYSINVVNYGFDAIVGAKGNENKLKGKKDPYGFGNAILPAILHGRFNKIEVYADGEKLNEKKLLLSSVSQGQWVGGEYHASPKSNNADGLLDVIVVKTMSFITMMGKFFGAYQHGTHLDNPKLAKKVIYRQAKEVDIVAPEEIDICIDGEIVKGKQFKLKSLPGAIKLVIPE